MKKISAFFLKSLIILALFTGALLNLSAQAEQLINGDFSSGSSSWWSTTNISLSPSAGQLTATVASGTTNPWDALVGQDAITLTPGETYKVSLDIKGSAGKTLKVVVQLGGPPYTSSLNEDITLTSTMTTYEYTFNNTIDTDSGQFLFQAGGATSPASFTIDNVSLKGGAEVIYTPDTGPAVRVNQVGYLPDGPKKATFVTEVTSPFTWYLKDSSKNTVATGQTTYFGYDVIAGDTAHLIDFSSYSGTGTGYVLTVNNIDSYAFDISSDLYEKLKYDALAYFYHNRSGIAIESQYVGSTYARPAGHIGVSPNRGDISVPTGAGTPGNYSLDVSGGWYDAGDHGKYVVNGGISVWKLLNQYERTLYAPGADKTAFADSKMSIPEQNNGVADILDEVRWQMEFMLKMQVPAGEAKAGMAHHKVHDVAWTALPTLPHLDSQMRTLRPPSVTATLNLAATAAQAARLWEVIDPAFSAKCLTAAETAWNAALANPTDYALITDNAGGGAYEDSKAEDEFYWAAAELFITTGKTVYKNYIKSSPYALGVGVTEDSFYWATCAPLGDISLIQVPNTLSSSDLNTIKNAILTAADNMITNINTQAYPNPYKPLSTYFWGSNTSHMNNVIILGTAYDISGSQKYLDAVFESMDYILGRNALNFSYVSGYGDVSLTNPHHRHWAHQKDPSTPLAPPGCLAGGPNSGLEDPVAQRLLAGLPTGKTYIDDIESWSTNEITINWNSALSWAVAYVSEKAKGTVTPTMKGDVNNDNIINIIDALMIAQSYVGLIVLPNPAAGDVNCDGEINIIDALMTAQKYVGLLLQFPCN